MYTLFYFQDEVVGNNERKDDANSKDLTDGIIIIYI